MTIIDDAERGRRTDAGPLSASPRLSLPASLSASHRRRCWTLALLLAFALTGVGCGTSRPYTLGPIKTVDPDRRPIDPPEPTERHPYWNAIDLTVFHQLEKPLDLNWLGRQTGRALGLVEKQPADNVNALGEVPNSSWFTRRVFYHDLTPAELARGPNTGGGPDTSRTLLVTGGKMEGNSLNLSVIDARGERYVLKFDEVGYSELASGAEAIAAKIFWGAGYFVPETYVTYFDPDRLRVAEGARLTVEDEEQPLTGDDLARFLTPVPRTGAGLVRALASKRVEGRPMGPWAYRGTRDDDPNDRVLHQHRRELRAMRVISAWLNATDRHAANTLAAYTDGRYLRHYLIDFDSALGSDDGRPHRPIHGQAYLIDPRYIAFSWLALGTFVPVWERVDPLPEYPSVGYFRAEPFEPGRWVPTYPNPAFENMTLEDAYWGAKLVMSFTDEDLAAIVETARYTDPEVEAYVLEVLKKRRDETGRYWFNRVNPLDRFQIASGDEGVPVLHFDDLAVTSGLASAEGSVYVYRIYHDERRLRGPVTVEAPAIPLRLRGGGIVAYLARRGADNPHERVVRVEVRTRRADTSPRGAVHVYLYFPEDGPPRVVGEERGA